MKYLIFLFISAIFQHLAALPPGAQGGDYLQVTGPCSLSFPADHGPHPGYRTEWWYYTGNLTGGSERRFGFQLTFFRTRLKPPSARQDWPEASSQWRTDQIYLAHAAVTDIEGRRHLQAENMARPVLSMAGAEQDQDTWKIHLNTWHALIAPNAHHLQADTEAFALTLDLKPAKPPVLHGEAGYSRKGQSPERASCYYSFTRLAAEGALTLDGARHNVKGSAWMDHEFSTAALQPDISGWDWFSLQLSDQTEIMIFLLRRPDGSLNPASAGTLVWPAGQTRHLSRDDLRIEPLAFWTSPHSGARYPVQWKVAIDSLECELTVAANLADQEMRTPRSTRVVYWEGSVHAQGSRQGKPLAGAGYVELTGYAAPFEAPM
ncbi:MAG: carotenoid 1,2-hydratase [Desulfobacteraceae bacterium]|nr:MAG: carotenoid 1,2-hydratase [Desulfobacteraceae bacterium]